MPNPWDHMWVKLTESKAIFDGTPYTLEEFAELHQKAQEALAEAKRTAEDGIDPESFYLEEYIQGDEDGNVNVSVYVYRDLLPEEIDAEKKRLWEKNLKDTEERELKQYLRLKEKFASADQNML